MRRHCCWLLLGFLSATILFSAAFCMGAAAGDGPLRTGRLEILGPDGQPRIVLDASGGAGTIGLMDGQRRLRVMVTVEGDIALLNLLDAAGQSCVAIAAQANGDATVSCMSRDGARVGIGALDGIIGLNVARPDGETAACVGLVHGRAQLAIAAGDDSPLISLRETDVGGAALLIRSAPGGAGFGLHADAGGNASAALLTEGGRPAAMLDVRPGKAARFIMATADGEPGVSIEGGLVMTQVPVLTRPPADRGAPDPSANVPAGTGPAAGAR